MQRAASLCLATVACCIATASPLAAPPHPATGAYRLQMPGDFHGGEPVARNGQRWLALRVDGEGRARLDQARLQVLPVEDAMFDGPGETSGRRVQADGAESLAFLRGPALRSGPVDTAQVESLGLPGLPDARIVLAGQDYRLQTDCAPFEPTSETVPQTSLSPNCRVVLRRGRAEAVLMEAPAVRLRSGDGSVQISLGDDAAPQLLFAGDLDHDGQLDLLFDVTDHYNVQRPTLFLSSPASPSPASSSPAPSGPALSGQDLSRSDPTGPSLSNPGTSRPAPQGADTPDPAGHSEALPLRAVAEYEAVGC